MPADNRDEFFWQLIEAYLEKTYGKEAQLGVPMLWKKQEALGFIQYFAEELASLCEHPDNAAACGVISISPKNREEALEISYSTFRRIFKIQQRNNVHISIKNRFAIFCGTSWGCRSFEDYVRYHQQLSQPQENFLRDPAENPTETDPPSSLPTFGEQGPLSSLFTSYNKFHWVGRVAEIQELYRAYEHHTRILSLLGITGIGKTALAERLTEIILTKEQPQRRKVWTIDFFGEERHKGNFLSFTKSIINALGIPIINPNPSPEQLMNHIVSYLQTHPCLILINSVEYIMTEDQDLSHVEFADPLWNTFFLNVCKVHSFHSLMVLTSQIRPDYLITLKARYASRLYEKPVSGLHRKEAMELFRKRGIKWKPHEAAEGYLTRIATAFDGHPLALETIAGEIQDDFGGDVDRFWSSYSSEIIEAEQSLQENGDKENTTMYTLHNWSPRLREKLAGRMEHTFHRLSQGNPKAYLLLLMISHRPILSKPQIISHMKRLKLLNREEVEKALSTLENRFLLTRKKDEYEQHDLIRSVSKKNLKRIDKLHH